MKCPACGYVSLEKRARCKRCGARADGGRGSAGYLEVGEEELAALSPRPAPPSSGQPGEDLRIDDDLPSLPDPPPAPGRGEGASGSSDWSPAAARFAAGRGRGFPAVLAAGAAAGGDDAGPIVDRDEQVPERFWAPQAAGLGRRALALGVDLALLAAVLGLFFAGAYVALVLRGFDMRLVASPQGRQAALLPFGLLALLLGLGYFVPLHAVAGRTPGKSLMGLQVLRRDGSLPSPVAALTRWLFALLGAVCAGVGVLWALFEPRRRGWADLCSGTVIAERRRDVAEAPPALTSPVPAGTMRPLKTGRDSSAGRATD